MNNVSAQINCMAIKLRNDSRYEGRITINGNRKSFYGSTKTEVKQKAKEYLQKVENGFREPQKITLNDYMEYWLVTYKLNKIELSSYTRLWNVYKCQVKSGIGKKMIGDITTRDIQKLIDEHANPPSDKIKPLTRSGLKRLVQLLNPCLRMAVKEGIIHINPCTDVIIPIEGCIQKETKEQFSLSDEEIEDFRIHALEKYKTTGEYKSRDGFILLIILNLGLRVGEALALEWTDINKNDNIVYINKTVQSDIRNFTDSGNAIISRVKHSTKTKAGVRVLKLNERVMEYIKELQEYDIRNHITSDYLCCTKKGTRVTARNMERSLDRIMKRCMITDKKVSLHTLRHTFGSTLIRRGIGIEVVSKLMGHANITITYNKYIHVIQEQEAKAMDMVKIC